MHFADEIHLPTVEHPPFPEPTPTADVHSALKKALEPVLFEFNLVPSAPWYSNETALCNVFATFLPLLGMRQLLLEVKLTFLTWLGQNKDLDDFLVRHQRWKWAAHVPGAWAMEYGLKHGFKGMPGVTSQEELMTQLAIYAGSFYDLESRPNTDNFIAPLHAATWTGTTAACHEASCIWPTAMTLCGMFPKDAMPAATAISQCIHGTGHSLMFHAMEKALPRAELGSACVQPVIGETGPASVMSLELRHQVKREGVALLDGAPTYAHAVFASSGFFEPYHSQLMLPSEMLHSWINECVDIERYSWGCYQQSIHWLQLSVSSMVGFTWAATANLDCLNTPQPEANRRACVHHIANMYERQAPGGTMFAGAMQGRQVPDEELVHLHSGEELLKICAWFMEPLTPGYKYRPRSMDETEFGHWLACVSGYLLYHYQKAPLEDCEADSTCCVIEQAGWITNATQRQLTGALCRGKMAYYFRHVVRAIDTSTAPWSDDPTAAPSPPSHPYRCVDDPTYRSAPDLPYRCQDWEGFACKVAPGSDAAFGLTTQQQIDELVYSCPEACLDMDVPCLELPPPPSAPPYPSLDESETASGGPLFQYGVDQIASCEPSEWRSFGDEEWKHAVMYEKIGDMDRSNAVQLTDSLRVGTCTFSPSDEEFAEKGDWRTQRVGPFTSLPGNMVRVGWHDCLRTTSLLEAVAPSSLALTAGFTWVVDAQGKAVGNPPIHLHGAFIQPLKLSEVDPLINGDCDPTLWMPMCAHSSTSIFGVSSEEAQCTAEDGGLEGCGAISYHKDFEMQFSDTLSCGFIVNDQRPPGSAPFEFFVQATAHLEPPRRTALSVHTPWYIPVQPWSVLSQMRVPTNVESYLLYTYVLPISGTLVFAYGHSHMGAEESYLISGAPADFGLAHTEKREGPLLTSETPFHSNAALKAHFLDAITASPSARILQMRRGSSEVVDGRVYARKPHFKYSNIRWPLRAGDALSGVALYAGTPEMPHAVEQGYQLTHDVWWLMYTDGPSTELSLGLAQSLAISTAGDGGGAPSALRTTNISRKSIPLRPRSPPYGSAAVVGAMMLLVIVSVPIAIRLQTLPSRLPLSGGGLL